MNIYDDNQMHRGKLDIGYEWDTVAQTDQMWTLVVILPQIGAFVTYQDESYVITRTVTYQEELDHVDITTLCRISRIDDEGDLLPIEGKEVRATDLTLI